MAHSHNNKLAQQIKLSEVQVVVFSGCCPKAEKGNGFWTGPGVNGIVSKGLSIQSHKLRYVNRFQRRKATRFDNDHRKCALNRKNLIAGANKENYHLRNVTPGRDFQVEESQ